jgi:hypothetical protein
MSTAWKLCHPCAVVFLLVGPAALRADPPQVPPETQRAINIAIDKGARYLRSTQKGTGTWAKDDGGHKVGYAALPALTLLECGATAKDRNVLFAAGFVRNEFFKGKIDNTYEISLAILLLDRLGEKGDRPMIEALALRLVAGQTPTGGWSYRCPVLDSTQHQGLLATLKVKNLTIAKTPAYWRTLPIFQDAATLVMEDPKKKTHEPQNGTTDNSNTQFAILALWAARRHGVPVQRSLDLLVRRFDTSQNKNGSWGYHYKNGGGEGGSAAMNCVGLLGLAVGHGLAREEELKGGLAPEPAGVAALAGAPGLPAAAALPLRARAVALEKARKRAQDQRIVNGFVALDRHIGQPTGKLAGVKMENLYFLWSVERVGVLYNLQRIGTKDWYLWGAEVLVSNQDRDGHWQDGGYHGASATIDTCLALLFLKRANFAVDLANALPFNPDVLTQDIVKKLEPAPKPVVVQNPVGDEDKKPKTTKTAEPTPVIRNPVARPPVATVKVQHPTHDVPDKSLPSWVWMILLFIVACLLAAGGVFNPWVYPILFGKRRRKRDDEDDEDDEDRKRRRKKKRSGASSTR